MKIIQKLIVDGKLPKEVEGLKCYIIIDIYGDKTFKAFPVEISGCEGNFVMAKPFYNKYGFSDTIYFNTKTHTDNHKLVITDNLSEAKYLASMFRKFGYVDSESDMNKLRQTMDEMEEFYETVYETALGYYQSFNEERTKREVKTFEEQIKENKKFFPPYLKIRKKSKHGDIMYLTGITKSGTAWYHYPTKFGDWYMDVTVENGKFVNDIGLDSTQFCSATEDEFINAYDVDGTREEKLKQLKYVEVDA